MHCVTSRMYPPLTWVFEQVICIYDDGILTQNIRHQMVELEEFLESYLARVKVIPTWSK